MTWLATLVAAVEWWRPFLANLFYHLQWLSLQHQGQVGGSFFVTRAAVSMLLVGLVRGMVLVVLSRRTWAAWLVF